MSCFYFDVKVKELEEGKTYVFQIRAVNASGIGKPSDISEPVLVQARPGKYVCK